MLCVRPLLLLLLFTALPAWGQGEEPSTQRETDRFLIEKITVQGPKQAAANIIRSETLLREGGTYTEEQLRLAIYRIHRLPFVLDASFALRRGSRRGAYELVIEAKPARWFFFDHSIHAFRFGEALDLEDSLTTDPTMRSSTTLQGLVGARLFVGRSGVLFGALDSEEGIQAGFTQYDLLHRGILANVGYSRNECCIREVLPLALDPTFSSWSFTSSEKFSLGLAIPLGGRQSIQVSASERRGDAGTRRGVLVESPPDQTAFFQGVGTLIYRRAEAKWVYDTSDDPLVPTRGFSISAGLEAARLESPSLVEFPGVPSSTAAQTAPFPASESEEIAAAASVIKHWPIARRQTLSLTGRLFQARSRLENLILASEERVVRSLNLDTLGGSVGVQYAVAVQRSRKAGNFSDLRLEAGVEMGVESNRLDLGPSPLRRFAASLGLVFRNQWGRVRATFTYLDLGSILP